MRALREQIEELDGNEVYGRVVGVRGLMVEVAGPLHAMSVGARVVIETKDQPIPCEVVGFSGNNALLMPFAPLEGVRRGCLTVVSSMRATVRPSQAWLARGGPRGAPTRRGCARGSMPWASRLTAGGRWRRVRHPIRSGRSRRPPNPAS